MISNKNLVPKIWIQSVSLLLQINDTSWKKFITCKSYLQSFWNMAFKSCVPKTHGPKCKRWLEFFTLHSNWAQKSILRPNLGSKKFHVELWCSFPKTRMTKFICFCFPMNFLFPFLCERRVFGFLCESKGKVVCKHELYDLFSCEVCGFVIIIHFLVKLEEK